MKEVNITIPDESYTVVQYQNNGLPAIATINEPILKFEAKEVFSYELFITIDFKEPNNVGMPSEKESKEIDDFVDVLESKLVGFLNKPNVLIVAWVSWDGKRDLFFRVHDPEIAHKYLQSIIETEGIPKFDYIMRPDKKWKSIKWISKLLKGKR